jgi:hypothetical protein
MLGSASGLGGKRPAGLLPGSPKQSGLDSAATSFYASPNPDDVSVGSTFYATGLCQTDSGCNYSYVGLPTGCSSLNTGTLPCTPTATGTFIVNATATAICVGLCLSWSGQITFVVNPDVQITSLTAVPSEVDVGHSLNFSMTISDGTAPFTYAWSGLPSGCVSANVSTLKCVPTKNGTFSILGTVHDKPGSQASSSVALTVEPAITITGFAADPSQTGLGGSVTFTVTTSGGTPPISYVYTNLPPGCSSTDAPSLSCTPSQAGSYTVSVAATDSETSTASATTTVTIDSGPSITSEVWNPASVDLGQSSTLSVTVTGGTAPYTYSYTGLPAGCSSSNTSTLTCTPTATGSFTVNITVVDAHGLSAQATAPLSVHSALSASFSENVSKGTVPLEVGFNSTVQGGGGPFVYNWTFGDGGTSTLADPVHWFRAVGNYTVQLQVRDAGGALASFSANLLVEPSPGPSDSLSVLTTPATCGPITVGTDSASNGNDLELPAGDYNIVAPTCPGELFDQWQTTGGASVANASQPSATLQVSAAGTLTATYSTDSPGGKGPQGGGGHGFVLSPDARTLTVIVALVLAVWGLVYLGRRATRTPPANPRPSDAEDSGAPGTSTGRPPAGAQEFLAPTSPGPSGVGGPAKAANVGGGATPSGRSSQTGPSGKPPARSDEPFTRPEPPSHPAQNVANSAYRAEGLPLGSGDAVTPNPRVPPESTRIAAESIVPATALSEARERSGYEFARAPGSQTASPATVSVVGPVLSPAVSGGRGQRDRVGPSSPARSSPAPASDASLAHSPAMSSAADGQNSAGTSTLELERGISTMIQDLRADFSRLPPDDEQLKPGMEYLQRAVEMLRTRHYGAAQAELNHAALLLHAQPRSSTSKRSGGL